MIPGLISIIITLSAVLYAPLYLEFLDEATSKQLVHSTVSIFASVVLMKYICLKLGEWLNNSEGMKFFYNIYVYANILPAYILSHATLTSSVSSVWKAYIITYAASFMVCSFITYIFFFIHVMTKKNPTTSDYLLLAYIFRDRRY